MNHCRLLFPMDIQYLKNTAHYQRKLIDAAVHLVRKGGHLVYSTCTISPLENEYNVRYILDKYPFLKLVQSDCHLGGPGLQGSVDAGGYVYELLKPDEAVMVQRFDPDFEGLDTMGFFIAKFVRAA